MLFLNVPFHQKDEAKKPDLGAKWNGEIKKWYADDRKKYFGLAKWFPHKGNIVIFDYLYIVSGIYTCYNCKNKTKVILLAASDFIDIEGKEKISDEKTADLFNQNRLCFIQKVTSLPFEFNVYLRKNFGYYEERFSNGSYFFANHCEHCRKLLGDMYISGENGAFRYGNTEDKENFLVYKIKLENDLVVGGKVSNISKNYLLKKPDKIQPLLFDNSIMQYDVKLGYDNVDCDIYVGANCGDIILEDIKNAKKYIKIISPYISKEWLEKLKERSENNIKVKLLADADYVFKNGRLNAKVGIDEFLSLIPSSDESSNKKFNLTKNTKYLLGIIGLTVLSINELLLGIILLVILGLFLKFSPPKEKPIPVDYKSVFPMRFYRNPYENNFQPGFPYMHSKIYIIDDTVYLGSINFTQAGFDSQFETRITIKDGTVVEKFNKLFDEIYSNGDYCSKKNIAKRLFLAIKPPSIEKQISNFLKPYLEKTIVFRKYFPSKKRLNTQNDT